jgi:hypothetical protein
MPASRSKTAKKLLRRDCFPRPSVAQEPSRRRNTQITASPRSAAPAVADSTMRISSSVKVVERKAGRSCAAVCIDLQVTCGAESLDVKRLQ